MSGNYTLENPVACDTPTGNGRTTGAGNETYNAAGSRLTPEWKTACQQPTATTNQHH